MTAPKRIQISRHQAWRAQNPNAVIVARPTIYGNPFRAGHRYTTRLHNGDSLDLVVTSPAHAVAAYRLWLLHDLELPNLQTPSVTHIITELRGRDLACWCHPDSPCHADVLLELANLQNSQTKRIGTSCRHLHNGHPYACPWCDWTSADPATQKGTDQ